MGYQPTSDYEVAPDDDSKQALIYQRYLRSNILSLWNKNLLATDAKHKLRAYKTSYSYNSQDDGAVMFFVIVKMVHPDTLSSCSDINTKLEKMKLSHLKHDIPRENL